MIPCFAHLKNHLDDVTEYIRGNLEVQSPFIDELLSHFLATPGQRIRPSLVLAFATVGTERVPPGTAGLAAMTELVHSASLLHDDVVDNGRMRRNRLTVNAKWGNKEAVLLGDLLLSRSLKPLVTASDPRIIDALYSVTASLSEGQLLELINFGNRLLDERTYFRIIELKTAIFFAECCRIGALAAGASQGRVTASAAFGLEIGFAFQILDDLLDVTASLASLGKDIQNDLLHGKMTLPTIYCLSDGEGRKLFSFPEHHPPDAAVVADYIRRSGAYDYCMGRARGHAAAALEAAHRLEDAALERILGEFADYLFSRVEAHSAQGGATDQAAGDPTSPA
ncbi:MAG: polyprenyl synthetase family protein [Candidatus Riflebacteria bacterium]|nr:polyprenyl synthetase family protein [Candidatus Riflebacteria bacterium]